MNFLSDEIPFEVAEDAIVMTSLISEKSVKNKAVNGNASHVGNGRANGAVSSFKQVNTTAMNGGTRSLKNSMYGDGSVSVHIRNPWAEKGDTGDEERYASIQSMSTKSAPSFRHETDSASARLQNITPRSITITHDTPNSLQHRKLLTQQTAAEIREMLQDMPRTTFQEHADMAAAAYREQLDFEAELSPITEEDTISSRTSSKGMDSLERNKRGTMVTKQYQDPMSKFGGESTLEEQYKEEEIEGENSRTSIKSYKAKRVTNKVYTGGDMSAIPELDSGKQN